MIGARARASLTNTSRSLTPHHTQAGSDALYYTGSDEHRPNFSQMNAEIHRVLRPGGAWLVVTRKTPLDWFAPLFALSRDTLLRDGEGRPFHVFHLVPVRKTT